MLLRLLDDRVGRAAQWLVNPYPNPYFASSGVVERSSRHRRHRYDYEDRW
jgi:hypothetical protein